MAELRSVPSEQDRADGSGANTEATSALPASFAQQRLWFLDRLALAGPAYHVSMRFRLSGGLDVSALESALNHVVARHEVLRTTFEEREGEVVQIIHAHRKHELPLVDLGDDRDPEETVLSLAAAEAERAFDLEKGPLLRASLLRLA